MEYKLNGKTYTTKELDFLELVNLEKAGVSIQDLNNLANKPFGTILNFVCYVTGLNKADANKEITAHLKNGGTMEEVAECIKVLTDSDFFK